MRDFEQNASALELYMFGNLSGPFGAIKAVIVSPFFKTQILRVKKLPPRTEEKFRRTPEVGCNRL